MALELLRFGVWCLYKKVQRSMFEHVCVCVCVCVPVLAIYQMSSAKVIWHDMDWTSGWHSWATCFFFCQVWILAKSLYFLSHCIRQTENIDKDLKEKNKKRCYCSFTSHSFEFGLVSGRRWPCEEGIWDISPRKAAQELVRDDRSACCRKVVALSRVFLAWADEQLKNAGPERIVLYWV